MKLLPIFLTSVVLSQNILVNGGFESFAGQYCLQSYCNSIDNPMPPAAIAPWYVSSAEPKMFELVSSLLWTAWGNWSMDLSTNQPTTISQAVTLVPQKLYVLKLKLNRSPHCGGIPEVKTGWMSATGVQPLRFKHIQVSGVAHIDSWKDVKYLFKATVANTTISVASTTSGACGPAIDEIYLTEFSPYCTVT